MAVIISVVAALALGLALILYTGAVWEFGHWVAVAVISVSGLAVEGVRLLLGLSDDAVAMAEQATFFRLFLVGIVLLVGCGCLFAALRNRLLFGVDTQRRAVFTHVLSISFV